MIKEIICTTLKEEKCEKHSAIVIKLHYAKFSVQSKGTLWAMRIIQFLISLSLQPCEAICANQGCLQSKPGVRAWGADWSWL